MRSLNGPTRADCFSYRSAAEPEKTFARKDCKKVNKEYAAFGSQTQIRKRSMMNIFSCTTN